MELENVILKVKAVPPNYLNDVTSKVGKVVRLSNLVHGKNF